MLICSFLAIQAILEHQSADIQFEMERRYKNVTTIIFLLDLMLFSAVSHFYISWKVLKSPKRYSGVWSHWSTRMQFVCLLFFPSCPEWEKTHWCSAQRETCQLCCFHPKDLHSQGPKQSTHRHANLYLRYGDRRLQVSGNQICRQSSGLGFCVYLSCWWLCWCYWNWGSMMLCVMCRSSLLDQGMLVNIQQPVIRSDGTLLLATDSKVKFSAAWYILEAK